MLLELGAFGIKNNTISLVVDLVILFLVVMWLALVYWTYADARRRAQRQDRVVRWILAGLLALALLTMAVVLGLRVLPLAA